MIYSNSYLSSIVNGQFGKWSSFGACSETCGQGTQTRTRKCDSPAPAHGGDDCDGDDEQSRQCQVKPCPGYFILHTLVLARLAQSIERSPCNRKFAGSIPASVNSTYE